MRPNDGDAVLPSQSRIHSHDFQHRARAAGSRSRSRGPDELALTLDDEDQCASPARKPSSNTHALSIDTDDDDREMDIGTSSLLSKPRYVGKPPAATMRLRNARILAFLGLVCAALLTATSYVTLSTSVGSAAAPAPPASATPVPQRASSPPAPATSNRLDRPAAPQPAARFDHTEADNADHAREQAWFRSRSHPVHDTFMVVSINSGAMELAMNMVCSLIRNVDRAEAGFAAGDGTSSSILDHLVFWAMDKEAAERLEDMRQGLLEGSLLMKRGDDGRRSKNGARSRAKDAENKESDLGTKMYASAATPPRLFGIYYDASLSTKKAGLVNWAGDASGYDHMMDLRLDFFVRLTSTLGLNFLFSDADIYFLSNPFTDLNLPHGVPPSLLASNSSSVAPSSAINGTDIYRATPDLIYSTDARSLYHLLRDPFEGEPRVPKICGGFFWARANSRSAALFSLLRSRRLNDQRGIVQLLNGDELEAVLVDPLPAGMRRRKPFLPAARPIAGGGGGGNGPSGWSLIAQWFGMGGNRDVGPSFDNTADEIESPVKPEELYPPLPASDVDGVIRVRILSQAAYANALPEYAPIGTRGPGFHRYREELEERGEREVLYHPNYWKETRPSGRDLQRGFWPWSDNKTLAFEGVDMWKVKEGRCLIN
ncbi:hypothetical protein HK101_006387 [Irineochytrium annulatum]|nr:hypothetical protein HK101_006387 [Irineochytrium annulatum]